MYAVSLPTVTVKSLRHTRCSLRQLKRDACCYETLKMPFEAFWLYCEGKQKLDGKFIMLYNITWLT